MKIKNMFFCEDIRAEADGKVSTMGLLGDVISVNIQADGPESVSLQLAVLVTLENEGKQYESIDLSSELFTDEVSVGKIQFPVELKKAGTLYYIPLPKFNLDVAESMDVKMQAKVIADKTVISQQEVTLQAQVFRIDDETE